MSLERSFELPICAEQLASTFVEFRFCKRRKHGHTYALNVLDYIDASALQGRDSRAFLLI